MSRETFRVENVKCEGCATTLKRHLEPYFGSVEVDLSKMPREIVLDIEQEQIPKLQELLLALGYPLVDEQLGFATRAAAKAKSFVGCAIGKIEYAKSSS